MMIKIDNNTLVEINRLLINYGCRTIGSFVLNVEEHREELENIRILYQIDILNIDQIHLLTVDQIEHLKRYESFLSTSEMMTKDEIFGLIKNVTFFACIFLVMCFAYLVCLTWIPVPKDNVRFADTTLGFILGTLMTTIATFIFSSQNSVSVFRKDRRSSDKKETPVTPAPPIKPKCDKKKESEEEVYSSEE